MDFVGDVTLAPQLSFIVTGDLRFGVGRQRGFFTGKGRGFLSDKVASLTARRGDGNLGLLN